MPAAIPMRLPPSRCLVAGDPPRIASSDAFWSSIVLMLICIRLRLICSQPSMIAAARRSCAAPRSGRSRRTSPPDAETAALRASPRRPQPAPGMPVAAPGAKPGTGTPNGFHIFCMNSSASCGVNGNARRRIGIGRSLAHRGSWALEAAVDGNRRGGTTVRSTGVFAIIVVHDGQTRNPAGAARGRRRQSAGPHGRGRHALPTSPTGAAASTVARSPSCVPARPRKSPRWSVPAPKPGTAAGPAGRQYRPLRRRDARRERRSRVAVAHPPRPRARRRCRRTAR